MKIFLILAAAFLGVALVAPGTQAKFFVGSSADITDFTNGSEVSTRGTLVDAVNLLNDNVEGIGVSTTINGVLFKGTQPGAFHENAESFQDASFVYHGGDAFADAGLWTSGGAYDTLADSQIFNLDKDTINYGDGFGVVNLIPGQLYELQIFMLDDRSGISKTFPIQFQQVHFTGDADQFDSVENPDLGFLSNITIGGNGVTQANGEIATVTFAIDAEYNGIFVNSWDNGAYNGMQLRAVTLPGDLDLDNDVDGQDLVVWQRGLGAPYTVDDLTSIKQFFGASLSVPAIAAAPEPAAVSLALLAVGVLQGVAHGRRRHGFPC